MTVLASLYSGISGIVSNGSALSVSGDNIANMNTMAFKASNALFESNLTQRIGEVEVGLGSRLAATNTAFTPGAFSSSSRSTDLAIQGNGFFIVQNSQGERFYTRAGSFTQNASGDLVSNVGGFFLLGYKIDEATGSTVGELSTIRPSSVNSLPKASTTISMSLNLDPHAEILGNAFNGSSFAAAEASSNFSVPSTLYDSRGTPRSVVTYFRRTDENTWSFYTLTLMSNLEDGGGATLDPADENSTVILKAGEIEFKTDGTFDAKTYGDQGATQWDAGGDAIEIEPGELLNADSDIRWAGADLLDWEDFELDFGDLGGSDAVATQSNGESVVTRVASNGRGFGELQSVEITSSGMVRGLFSNGESRNLYQIPLAIFPNNEGLVRVGSNVYQATSRSGDPLIGAPASSGRGEITAFALEQSNVDLATEFVKIIQFQRAFQASARTISSAADLLQDLVNLGR